MDVSTITKVLTVTWVNGGTSSTNMHVGGSVKLQNWS